MHFLLHYFHLLVVCGSGLSSLVCWFCRAATGLSFFFCFLFSDVYSHEFRNSNMSFDERRRWWKKEDRLMLTGSWMYAKIIDFERFGWIFFFLILLMFWLIVENSLGKNATWSAFLAGFNFNKVSFGNFILFTIFS